MTPIEKAVNALVETAESEIGYVEKASNSQLESKTSNPGNSNYTKYGAYFDAQRGEYEFFNGKKNGFDWCDQFNDWCFAITFGIDTARRMLYQPMKSLGAGCKYSAGYFRENKAWTSVPGVGYQIFFGPKYDESHTGIVVAKSADKVWTVEGNKSNRVMRCVYAINDSNIAGYGIPNYALVADRYADPLPPIADDSEPEYVTKEDFDSVVTLLDNEIRYAKRMVSELAGQIDARFDKELGTFIHEIDEIKSKKVRTVMRRVLDSGALDGGTAADVNPNDANMRYELIRVLTGAVRYSDAKMEDSVDG